MSPSQPKATFKNPNIPQQAPAPTAASKGVYISAPTVTYSQPNIPAPSFTPPQVQSQASPTVLDRSKIKAPGSPGPKQKPITAEQAALGQINKKLGTNYQSPQEFKQATGISLQDYIAGQSKKASAANAAAAAKAQEEAKVKANQQQQLKAKDQYNNLIKLGYSPEEAAKKTGYIPGKFDTGKVTVTTKLPPRGGAGIGALPGTVKEVPPPSPETPGGKPDDEAPGGGTTETTEEEGPDIFFIGPDGVISSGEDPESFESSQNTGGGPSYVTNNYYYRGEEQGNQNIPNIPQPGAPSLDVIPAAGVSGIPDTSEAPVGGIQSNLRGRGTSPAITTSIPVENVGPDTSNIYGQGPQPDFIQGATASTTGEAGQVGTSAITEAPKKPFGGKGAAPTAKSVGLGELGAQQGLGIAKGKNGQGVVVDLPQGPKQKPKVHVFGDFNSAKAIADSYNTRAGGLSSQGHSTAGFSQAKIVPTKGGGYKVVIGKGVSAKQPKIETDLGPAPAEIPTTEQPETPLGSSLGAIGEAGEQQQEEIKKAGPKIIIATGKQADTFNKAQDQLAGQVGRVGEFSEAQQREVERAVEGYKAGAQRDLELKHAANLRNIYSDFVGSGAEGGSVEDSTLAHYALAPYEREQGAIREQAGRLEQDVRNAIASRINQGVSTLGQIPKPSFTDIPNVQTPPFGTFRQPITAVDLVNMVKPLGIDIPAEQQKTWASIANSLIANGYKAESVAGIIAEMIGKFGSAFTLRSGGKSG